MLLILLVGLNFAGNRTGQDDICLGMVFKGIGEYNKLQGSALSLFGSDIAASVRGVGGIYIRSQQEKMLKKAIAAAAPAIEAMTTTVEETMALYLTPAELEGVSKAIEMQTSPAFLPAGLLANEKIDLARLYQDEAGRFEGKQPPMLPAMVADGLEACDNASLLAAGVFKAAYSLRVAHARLAKVILKKQDLHDALDEVQALGDEVKAAQALKKKLDNQ